MLTLLAYLLQNGNFVQIRCTYIIMSCVALLHFGCLFANARLFILR